MPPLSFCKNDSLPIIQIGRGFMQYEQELLVTLSWLVLNSHAQLARA
jgi:hypothetical protein